jgi:hypothetical protein
MGSPDAKKKCEEKKRPPFLLYIYSKLTVGGSDNFLSNEFN